jgi:acylpyruvate hydrolase
MTKARFFNFLEHGHTKTGILVDAQHFVMKEAHDIVSISQHFDDFKFDSLEIEEILDVEKIQFLYPVRKPGKVICVGLNYDDHVKELNRQTLGFPTFFSRFNHSFVAHKEDIPISTLSTKYDYEGELAIVIGKDAFQVTQSDSAEYIAGFSIFNDVTVRDYQSKTSQWFLGKNFYKTGAFGPYLAPASILPKNAQGLKIQTSVNGNILQDANTSDMIFKPAELVYELARIMPLDKGDIIITGTPGGVALSRKPSTYLKSGDICTITIPEIGTLENSFVDLDLDNINRSA